MTCSHCGTELEGAFDVFECDLCGAGRLVCPLCSLFLTHLQQQQVVARQRRAEE